MDVRDKVHHVGPNNGDAMSLHLSGKGFTWSEKPGGYGERTGRTGSQMNEGSGSFGSQSSLGSARTWQHVCGHPLISIMKNPPGSDGELVGTEASHKVLWLA